MVPKILDEAFRGVLVLGYISSHKATIKRIFEAFNGFGIFALTSRSDTKEEIGVATKTSVRKVSEVVGRQREGQCLQLYYRGSNCTHRKDHDQGMVLEMQTRLQAHCKQTRGGDLLGEGLR